MTSILSNVSYRAAYVWRRNFDVYLTTWLTNMVPPLFEPFQYILAFGLGLGGAVGLLHFRGEPVSYMRYIVPGTMAMAVMFWSFFECTFASFVRMYYQRTFDAITATPLMVEDVICGELMWGATKSLIAVGVMQVVLSFFGFIAYPSGLLIPFVSVIGGIFFAAVGLIATSRVPSIDNFNFPIFLFIFPMFVFSGTFFPVENLPTWIRGFAMALPLTHLARVLRAAALGEVRASDFLTLALFLVLSFATSVVAIAMMKRRLVK